GEEQQIGVRRGHEEVLDEVLVARRRADLPPPAAPLGAIEAHGVPLHVSLVGDRDHHVLFDDEVLDRDGRGLVDDAGPALVAVLLPDGAQLLDDDLRDLALVPRIWRKRAICCSTSACSATIFSRSRPVRRWRRMSSTACAWICVRPSALINPSRAVAGSAAP